MRLLNSYEDKEIAEAALAKVSGDKRLASERDSTVVIYNLFGTPSWGNFFHLGMYNLQELKTLLDIRDTWLPSDQSQHEAIVSTLKIVAKNYNLKIPDHWL